MALKKIAFGMLLAVIFGCETSAPEPPPASRPAYSFADCKAIIQDPFRSNYQVFEAIEDIRSHPAQDVPAKFWSDIANSTIYTPTRRRWAVLQLLDKYIEPDWTLKQIGDVLAAPSWLRQDEIFYLDVPRGGTGLGPLFPVDLDRGDSLVGIRVCLPSNDDSIFYLRLGKRPDTGLIYSALMGKESEAGGIPVKEIAPFFREGGDIGGMNWRGGQANGPFE